MLHVAIFCLLSHECVDLSWCTHSREASPEFLLSDPPIGDRETTVTQMNCWTSSMFILVTGFGNKSLHRINFIFAERIRSLMDGCVRWQCRAPGDSGWLTDQEETPMEREGGCPMNWGIFSLWLSAICARLSHYNSFEYVIEETFGKLELDALNTNLSVINSCKFSRFLE